jgi:hypothetical protein
MNQFARRITASAMLVVLLSPAFTVLGAENGTAVPGSDPSPGAVILDEDTRDDSKPATTVGYDWKTPPPDTPDWKGLGRDTAYFLAYQFLIVGLLYVAPESVSGWTDEQKKKLNWSENVKNPHRDSDENYINYLLHPYWGATYYIRGRERGLDGTQSFLFSAAMSTMYEFGVEAIFEKPSYQDLWATPVLGSLLGEFVFSPIREHIRAKPGDLDWGDKTILFFTDPLGVINAQSDRVIGVETTFRLQAIQPVLSARSSQQPGSVSNLPAEAALRPSTVAWGMQLQVRW